MTEAVNSNTRNFAGMWHIVEMEMWNEDYFNMEVQAYIHIRENGIGDFQFGLVSGSIDGYVQESESGLRFNFTWDGYDEMDPASGSGWLKHETGEKVRGVIKIHTGDHSRLTARRAA